jgi:hypothetical protein
VGSGCSRTGQGMDGEHDVYVDRRKLVSQNANDS